MPKIDFYILSEGSRLQLACLLIDKAYKNQHRVYVHTENQQEAHQLDELIWTFRDESFIPHNLYGEGPEPAPPIQIGFSLRPEKHRDILINLSPTIPEFFQQFNRVLELVANDARDQEIARDRFRQYRSQGFEIKTHKLNLDNL